MRVGARCTAGAQQIGAARYIIILSGSESTRKGVGLVEASLVTILGKGLGFFQCCPSPRGLGLSCAVGMPGRVLVGQQKQQCRLLDQ